MDSRRTASRRIGFLLSSLSVLLLVVLLAASVPVCALAVTGAAGEAAKSSDPAITPEEAAAYEGTEDTAVPLDEPGNTVSTGQLPDSSFLYDTSIAALAGADSYYDGQEVQVMGEAVGEAIRVTGDEDHCWVVLAAPEDNASVTTYMRVSDARKIDTYGAYGSTGSVLKVRGTFNLVCKEHDGESDLHVVSVTVVEAGSVHPDAFDARDFLPGVALTLIGLVLMLIVWRLRERQR